MKKLLLSAAALLTLFCGQAQSYQQNFEGSHNDIFNQGWRFVNLEGSPQNNGIYSPTASIQAIGIQGSVAGMATFNLVNQIPTHITNLDCVVISPAIQINNADGFVNYTTGSVSIGSNASSHYSVYIITKAQMDAATTSATLKSLLTARTADDEAIISNETVGTGFDLADYAGEAIHFIFRLHNSPTNSIFLVDDFKVTGAVLGIDDVKQQKVSVYPNPAADFITINSQGIEEVSFTDMNERTVLSKKNINTDNYNIEISGLSQGIYLMRVTTVNGITTQKVVKS